MAKYSSLPDYTEQAVLVLSSEYEEYRGEFHRFFTELVAKVDEIKMGFP